MILTDFVRLAALLALTVAQQTQFDGVFSGQGYNSYLWLKGQAGVKFEDVLQK